MPSCARVCFLIVRITLPVFISIFASVLPLSITASTGGGSLASRDSTVLKVLLPFTDNNNKFLHYDSQSEPPRVEGFCKDVFIQALSFLSSASSWTDIKYTRHEGTYTQLVRELNWSREFDAFIGDTAITSERLKLASFTQAYFESGIVMVTLDDGFARNWPHLFFEPFDSVTWSILVGSILVVCFTLWLLEGNITLQQHSSQAAKSGFTEFSRTLWFVTLILVFFRRDCIKNPLSTYIMTAWIFFILLLGASYTASMSSILTVSKRSQKLFKIEDLVNMKVGYQAGSFVETYLRRKNVSHLHPASVSEYGELLRSKALDVVVDEIPYISLFLEDQSASKCEFSVSEKLTTNGFGFAFYNKSLADAFSTAILELSESGGLQRLRNGWKLTNYRCPTTIQSTQLNLKNSMGLFIIFGAVISLIVVILLIHVVAFSDPFLGYERLRGRQRHDGIDDPIAHASTRRRNSINRMGLHASEMG